MEEGIVKDLLDDANERMDKSVEATKHEFGSVRTGRASPRLLDRVQVDYYGAITPLKQLANIAASEARLLTITPYDKSSIKAIEKAILESDVGLTPSNDGNLIRLAIPELTEERRKDLAKVVRRIAEEGRVGVRNVRRDVQHDLRELKSEGDLGADDEHRAEAELQKLTDQHTATIDAALAAKEKEILECLGRGRPGQGRRPGVRMAARYVAIIMDGNARWATERGLPVLEGHRRGAQTLKQTVRDAVSLDVLELTVYAFSTENWTRPREEVEGLMAMFAELIESETPGARRGGRADALHRPPRRRVGRAARAHGVGRGEDRPATTG